MTDSTRGIVLMVLAMAGFALGDASIKALGPVMGPGTILTALGLGGAILMGALIAAGGTPVPWRAALHPTVMARNLVEIVGVICVVTSLTLLPLTLVSAVQQSSPLWAMAGAALFLGEPAGRRRWIAVGAALVGVLVMISPWSAGAGPVLALPLVGAVAMGTRDVLTRAIPRGIPNAALAMWGNLAILPAALLLMAWNGESLPEPEPAVLGLLGAATLLAAGAYYAVTAAVRLAPVPVVVPFRYARILFAAVLAIVVFAEAPGPEVWIGAALVVGAGLFALRADPVPLPRPAR